MSTNNRDVISNWKNGIKAVNGRKSLWTDGKWLYSYRLRIGYRTTNGICILGNYTASSGDFRSNTTSMHVGRARRVVNTELIWHPAVFEASKEAFDSDKE
jgi:hypothetical protein